MNTFIILMVLAVMFILILGVSTRIIEDLTEIELDVRQVKKELKSDSRNTDKNHKDSAE